MSKRVNKPKEVIADEMKRSQEVARKRDIIVSKFYPALNKATVSVDEAKMLLQATSTLLMEEVLKTMRERKFDEINQTLLDKLTVDGERVEEITELLNTFNGENLFVTREIIEGMNHAVDHMINSDMQGRKLETLNPDWDLMLNK